MKTLGIFLLAVLVCLLCWVVLGVADFNAGYVMDGDAGYHRIAWLDYVAGHHAELMQALLPAHVPAAMMVLFFLPAFALPAIRHERRLHIVAWAVMGLLLALDVFQLFRFEGGDQKGCESCAGIFFLHLVVGAAIGFSTLWVSVLRMVRRSKGRDRAS